MRSITVDLVLAACRGEGEPSTRTLEDYGYDPKYKQITPALLAEEPDRSLEWAIMQHIAWTINQDYERQREIVSGLSPGLRMVYATHWVETEVNNGGFNQYFFNSTGRLADIALVGFSELGAAEHERLMREALAVYERVRPRLEAARKTGTMEVFTETYGDLSKLRIRYIREHPEQFGGR
jgi:hypothetical protein